MRLGPRPTLRRRSLGLETTANSKPAPGPLRLHADGAQVWPLIRPQFRTSLKKHFQLPPSLDAAPRRVVKPAVHRREAGWGRVDSLIGSVVSKPRLTRREAGLGPRLSCRPLYRTQSRDLLNDRGLCDCAEFREKMWVKMSSARRTYRSRKGPLPFGEPGSERPLDGARSPLDPP